MFEPGDRVARGHGHAEAAHDSRAARHAKRLAPVVGRRDRPAERDAVRVIGMRERPERALQPRLRQRAGLGGPELIAGDGGLGGREGREPDHQRRQEQQHAEHGRQRHPALVPRERLPAGHACSDHDRLARSVTVEPMVAR